jgi:hypothetical protein
MKSNMVRVPIFTEHVVCDDVLLTKHQITQKTLEKESHSAFSVGAPTQQTSQYTNTPTHQDIITQTHQHTNTPTHQHTNTPTHQHITPTHHTNTATHQHTDTPIHQHNTPHTNTATQSSTHQHSHQHINLHTDLAKKQNSTPKKSCKSFSWKQTFFLHLRDFFFSQMQTKENFQKNDLK